MVNVILKKDPCKIRNKINEFSGNTFKISTNISSRLVGDHNMGFQLKKVQSGILGSSNNDNSDTKDSSWRKMNPKSVRMAEM